jgi:hypothetical protein
MEIAVARRSKPSTAAFQMLVSGTSFFAVLIAASWRASDAANGPAFTPRPACVSGRSTRTGIRNQAHTFVRPQDVGQRLRQWGMRSSAAARRGEASSESNCTHNNGGTHLLGSQQQRLRGRKVAHSHSLQDVRQRHFAHDSVMLHQLHELFIRFVHGLRCREEKQTQRAMFRG